MKASLILPVLNHEDRLGEVLGEIRSRLASLNPEVIVVYDVTRPELLEDVRAEQEALAERYGIRNGTRPNESGRGGAPSAGVPAVWTNRQVGRSQFSMRRELPNYGRWLVYAAKRLPSRSFLVAAVSGGAASLPLLARGRGRGGGGGGGRGG